MSIGLLAIDLAKRPKSDATEICVASEGKPWKTGFNAFSAKFREGLLAEGKIGEGFPIHGQRHALGTMPKAAGLFDGDIAGHTGAVWGEPLRVCRRRFRLNQEAMAA